MRKTSFLNPYFGYYTEFFRISTPYGMIIWNFSVYPLVLYDSKKNTYTDKQASEKEQDDGYMKL
jgi:hypothetical protein